MKNQSQFPLILGTFFSELLKEASTNNYPPINIIRIDNEDNLKFKLEIGAIGFKKNEIKIELDPSNNHLSVTANSDTENSFDDNQYVHRRLSKKNFIYKTSVPDYTEVKNCSLENGLLTIDLEINKPKDQDIKSFEL